MKYACLGFVLLICALLACPVKAQESKTLSSPELDQTFQYAVPMQGMAEGKSAYLWLPEKSEKIRGLLIGGSVVIETDLVRSQAIRKVCAENDLGIVFMSPHPFGVFPYDQPAVIEALESTLKALAEKSGHPEIEKAPLMPFGHSVSTLFAQRLGYWNPDRVFGIMLFKGGLGGPLPSTPEATLKGIPLFLFQGQFEEFGPGPHGALRDFEDRTTGWRTGMAAFLSDRTKHPELLYGYIIHAGGTHYEWPIEHEELIAEFIRSCVDLRLPDVSAVDGAKLKVIDYKTQGVQVDAERLLKGSQGKKQPEVTDGKLWYPSQKLADLVIQLYDQMGLKPQYVAPIAGKKNRPVPVGHDMRLKLNGLHWIGPDLVRVRGNYVKNPPKKYPREQEGEAGHSDQPVKVRVMSGNIVEVGPGQFKVTGDLRWGKRVHVSFWSPGDQEYRHAAQHARLNFRYPFRKGEEQTIKFEAPSEVKVSSLPYRLEATSSSGLPVSFYVDHGPVKVNAQGELVLDQWPMKAGKSMEVKVVAYQAGSMKQPLFKTAPVVSHVIRLIKE